MELALVLLLISLNIASLTYIILNANKKTALDLQPLEALENRVNQEIKSSRAAIQSDLIRLQTSLMNQISQLKDAQFQELNAFNSNSQALQKSLTDSLFHFKNNVETTLSERLKDLVSQHEKLQESTRNQLEIIRSSVEEKLEKTLTERIGNSFQKVVENLIIVQNGLNDMQNLAKGVGDLQRVFSQPKTRGIFGEIQLQAILEDVLIKDSQFEINVKPIPNSLKTVEFAIVIHKDANQQKMYLPIDAKFPLDRLDELNKAYDSNDKSEIDLAHKALVTAIKTQAKNIREYIVPPYTADFAILYLPTESLYMEVIRASRLQETIFQDFRVVITGPTTLSAFLNAVRMGLQTVEIHNKSKEIWDLLKLVKDEFQKFNDTLETTKGHLNKASESVDNLMTTRTKKLLNALKTVDSDTSSMLLPD